MSPKISITGLVTVLLVIAFLIVLAYIVMYNNSYSHTLDNSMFSNNELACRIAGVDEVLINNMTYTCVEVLDSCDIDISFANRVVELNYDETPICGGLFWK